MSLQPDRPRVHFDAADLPQMPPAKPLKSAFKSTSSGPRLSASPPAKSNSTPNLSGLHIPSTVTNESEDITESRPKKSGPGLFELGPALDLEDVEEEPLRANTRYNAIEGQKSRQVSKENSRLSLHDTSGNRSSCIDMGNCQPISAANSPPLSRDGTMVDNSINFDNIPLARLRERRKKFSIEDESDEDLEAGDGKKKRSRTFGERIKAAAKGLYKNLELPGSRTPPRDAQNGGLQSGQSTPGGLLGAGTPVEPPEDYSSIISSLLRLHGISLNQEDEPYSIHTRTPHGTPRTSPIPSGTSTPAELPKVPVWHAKPKSPSTSSLSILAQQSSVLAQPAGPGKGTRPVHKRSKSSGALSMIKRKFKALRSEQQRHHQAHIQAVKFRHRYLRKLCKALIQYGAPTHRLEEYMNAAAKTLAMQAHFLYLPGCMICSYDDLVRQTTSVDIIRVAQGLDLGKMDDVHDVYKAVTHDKLIVTDASMHLNTIVERPAYYPKWICILFYGLASAFVGPVAFQARLIDLPIAFLLGCVLGFMALVIAAWSDLFANIFEITAAIVLSFLARVFGSLHGGNLFCFSALAQSSIALILPGYAVLSAALELQSRNIVSGSIRMVFSIIYSLFLGFGITVGTSAYGAMDANASSETTCRHPMPDYVPYIFVLPFTLCLIIINQGKPRQMPIMLILSLLGFTVNRVSAQHLPGQLANCLGAFTIGLGANLYSRFCRGFAAAALVPAIFVQVPSGLAASGSLVSGISVADDFTNASSPRNASLPNNMSLSQGSTNVPQFVGGVMVNSEILVVGYIMIQIAIAITVGLFASALVVYPLGKKRSGLFSF